MSASNSNHVITQRYMTSEYLSKNQTWDIEDSRWKAQHALRILYQMQLKPNSICDIGCGAGHVLADLRRSFPQADLYGFDIAPDAAQFWSKVADKNLKLTVGDFLKTDGEKYDLVLLFDVLEHLPDPHYFLCEIAQRSKYFLFHFPLDLNAVSVLREKPLLHVRRSVGHIHYFTKNLALELLKESGFEVMLVEYSDAYLNAPQSSWRTKLFSIPRLVLNLMSKDFAARFFGGQTLFIVAKYGKT